MSGVSLWYERQFAFAFPAELYPNICIRLRGTPGRVEEIARDTSGEILTRKHDEKWSAQEHAGHLLDLEPLWLQRLEDFVQGRAELSTTDLRNRRRTRRITTPMESTMFWQISEKRGCGWSITFTSWPSTTTIIWRAFGS